MRTRLAIIATLVLGMVLSTAGAGLAVGGLGQDSDQASVAQYGGGVKGEEDQGRGDRGVEGEDEGGAVLPETGPLSGRADVAPAQQAEFVSDGGQLAFTGWAAIPVLVLGLALLTAGTLLLRRTGAGRRGS